MIHHIIKLIWNRRRSLTWIFIEQMLVFAVLLFTFIIFAGDITRRYTKGYIRVDNVASIEFSVFDTPQEELDTYLAQFHNMLELMKDWQSVESIGINRGAIPDSRLYFQDSVGYRGNYYRRVSIRYCDESFYSIFSPKLSEGQWFLDSDVSEIPPVLITQLLADNLGMTGSAVGQTIEYGGRTYRITGVVEAFKTSVTSTQMSALFLPVSLLAGTNLAHRLEYVVKYKPGMSSDFSRAFFAEFYSNFPRNQFQPALYDLSKRSSQMSFMNFSLKLYLFGIPVAFLIIFAFMGTFGLVWVQSKKRMNELGLRMAMGCTPACLQRTLIIENMILTFFAMLPGLIVIASLYAFAPKGWEWLTAVGAAVVLMLLFSAFSAWYPAWRASRVMPVEALRDNG